jgi:hypothetical protein
VKTCHGLRASATRRSNSSGVNAMGMSPRFTVCPATSIVTSAIRSVSGVLASPGRSLARTRATSSAGLKGLGT